MQVEQLHGARVPFFNCIEKPFFGEVFLLGLPRLIFSCKYEPQTRNTRPTAFTLLMQVEQLHGARVTFFNCIEKPFFGVVFFLGCQGSSFPAKMSSQLAKLIPRHPFHAHCLNPSFR
jgi:hypothetical protein